LPWDSVLALHTSWDSVLLSRQAAIGNENNHQGYKAQYKKSSTNHNSNNQQSISIPPSNKSSVTITENKTSVTPNTQIKVEKNNTEEASKSDAAKEKGQLILKLVSRDASKSTSADASTSSTGKNKFNT